MSEEQLKAHEERIREIVDIAVLLAPEPPQDGQETYTAKQMRVAVHEALLIPKPTPPNAEDANWINLLRQFKSGLIELEDFVSQIESFAHAHAAKAVEDERQRLARLVVEEILTKTKRLGYHGQLSETHTALRTEIGVLEQIRQWLTGDVGEKK